MAAEERTVSDGAVLSRAKTRVWGLWPKNETAIGALGPVTSTLAWGWPPFYDGTAVGRLDQRYYAVGAGRFNTPDPIGVGGAVPAAPSSWNQYSYTGGDPVNSTDPSGRLACFIDGIQTSCDIALPDCGSSYFNFIQLGPTEYCQPLGDNNLDGGGGETDTSPARYAAALRLKTDCVWASGTRITVGYTREMDWQVVDQFGNPFIGSEVPTVQEKVTVTSGKPAGGKKSWGDTWQRGNNSISPYGVFDDYLSANGGGSFTASQSFFVDGIALQLQDGSGNPFAGMGGTSLNNAYSTKGVTVDGTTSPRPCTDKDKKW